MPRCRARLIYPKRSELKFDHESELHNTKIQLQQQEQALELLSYTYAEQFKSLEKQLELQETAGDRGCQRTV